MPRLGLRSRRSCAGAGLSLGSMSPWCLSLLLWCLWAPLWKWCWCWPARSWRPMPVSRAGDLQVSVYFPAWASYWWSLLVRFADSSGLSPLHFQFSSLRGCFPSSNGHALLRLQLALQLRSSIRQPTCSSSFWYNQLPLLRSGSTGATMPLFVLVRCLSRAIFPWWFFVLLIDFFELWLLQFPWSLWFGLFLIVPTSSTQVPFWGFSTLVLWSWSHNPHSTSFHGCQPRFCQS